MESKELALKTDEELVFLAQSGDAFAEEEILLRYKKTVRACARRFFLTDTVIMEEDVVQEGMMGLFFAIRKFSQAEDGGASFKTFASLCIRRKIIDAVKKSANNRKIPINQYAPIIEWDELATSERSPEEQLIATESRSEFMKKLNKVLSDFEFRVVVTYVEGMSYAEIAEATNKSEKSVDNALQRSRAKLKKLLRN